MKDSRIGESLWLEWTGDDYSSPDVIVFYTEDHVDLENDVVKRALASALQRDGIVSSLSEGFKYVEKAVSYPGYGGFLDGDLDLTLCNEFGETEDGDEVDEVKNLTLVEIECQMV